MKNFMIFIFTYKKRLYLAYSFIALCILQVLAGCAMAILSVYVCLSVTKHLYAEKAEIQFVFSVFAIFGCHIIIEYLIGIKVVELCFVKAHKRSTKRNLYFWLLLCCNSIIDLLVLSALIVRISKHIIRSIRHSMEKGMRHYLTDPLWKHTMDTWQYSLRCCGINDYQDWYRISWLDKYRIKVDSPSVQSLLLSKDHLHLPITPWSCCDIDFPMQCFHDPLQQIDSVQIWTEQPEVSEMSLYRHGCLESIRYPIEICLVIFLVICIILILVHICIIIISRFLYTSCRNAVILHNCLGNAPGWLFSRDFMADRRGRTLSEIMLDLEHRDDSEESSANENDDFEDNDADDENEETLLLKTSTHGVAHAAPVYPSYEQDQNQDHDKPPPISTRRESLERSKLSGIVSYKRSSSYASPNDSMKGMIGSSFQSRRYQSLSNDPTITTCHCEETPSAEIAHNHQESSNIHQQAKNKPSHRRESLRSMNVSSLTTDPTLPARDYDTRPNDGRWSHKPLDNVAEQDEQADSARNPVNADMLMMGTKR